MKQPDWQRALSAQADVLGIYAGPYGIDLASGWLGERNKTYGAGAAHPSAVAFYYLIDDLIASEPLFVTEEMQDLTYRAMETFDPSEPLIVEDLFLRQGFALLEHPFVAADHKGKKVSWRAISWHYAEMPMEVSEKDGTKSVVEVRPSLRMMLWSHLDDKDDYTGRADWQGWQKWYRERGLRWSVAHATTIPLEVANDIRQMGNEGDPKADWLTFFRVLQRLMAEKIVAKHKRYVNRPVWREAARRRLDIREVIVIELRREQKPTSEESGEAHYSHRFIVHEHWRNQWYPSLQMHRQKFIGNYVKGPDDKPLIVKDRVWVWDR